MMTEKTIEKVSKKRSKLRAIVIIAIIVAIVIGGGLWYAYTQGFFSGGSIQKLPPATEIIQKCSIASKNIKTFKYNLKLEQTFSSEGVSQSIVITGEGEVNRTQKATHVKLSVGNQLFNEVYVVGNISYVYYGGKWYKVYRPLSVPQQAANITQILAKKCDMTVKTIETVNGKPAYRIEVNVPKSLYYEIYTISSLQNPNINVSALRKMMKINKLGITVWIYKDTYYTARVYVYMEVNITSINATGTIKVTMNYIDYNKPIIIKVPPEVVKNAIPTTEIYPS